MRKKLGDLLLKEGVITNAQLEEALKCQVIFGGKLGTNLIEMGAASDQDVSGALSRIFGVPAAAPEELLQVSPEALEALPRELAEKYGVVPVRLNRRRLSLAMSNPADLKVIDEIAFRTGCIIQPLVAAELCIVLGLEKAYGIPRSRRYINIAPSRPRAAAKPRSPREPVAPVPVQEPVLDLEFQGFDTLNDGADYELTEPDMPVQEPLPIRQPPVVPWPVAPAPVPPQPAAPAPQAPSLVIPQPPPPAPPAAPTPTPTPTPAPEAEEVPTSVAEQLIAARNRDDILDTLAACLSRRFYHAAVFLVRGETALGWKCTVEGKPVAGFEGVQISFDEPSVLKTVAESRGVHLGPIPRTPFNSMLLQDLGGRVPEKALLVPLLMVGRVVAILYVDAPGVDLGPYLVQLQKLTAKAAMAFEILVLQNKIISL
jgi:MshEN domain